MIKQRIQLEQCNLAGACSVLWNYAMHLLQVTKLLIAICLAPVLWGESVRWVFEGQVWEMDSKLEPSLGSTPVFSGSFELSVFEPYLAANPAGGEFFEGGLFHAEITLDRNHLVLLEGFQREGWPIVDLRPGEEADGIVFIVPMRSIEEQSGYELVWLELGLHGPAGEMLSHAGDWPDWESALSWEWGWFRLSFQSNSNDERIEILGDLSVFAFSPPELDPEEELERMHGLLAELALGLDDRDAVIADLNEQLALANERIAGLNRTLDRVWGEQDQLRAERDRLLTLSPSEDDEIWLQRIAEKEAEIAMLDEAYQYLQDDYDRLQYAFEDADIERRRLRSEIEGLRDALEQERNLRRRAESVRAGGVSPSSQPTDEEPNPAFRIVEHPIQLRQVGRSEPVSVDQIEVRDQQSARVGASNQVRSVADEEDSRDIRQALQRRRGPRGR